MNQPCPKMDSPSGCGHISPGPDELPGESWSPEPAKRSMRQPRAVWGPSRRASTLRCPQTWLENDGKWRF